MSDIELDQRWIKHKTEQNESKLVCPFCNQELIREGMNHWWCSCNIANKGRELYGTTSLWQELISTRKALDVAVDALKTFARIPQPIAEVAKVKLYAIKEITALEQKD